MDLDTNIKEKFCYLPRKLQGMEVTEKYQTLLIDSQMPCDMFNIICCTGNEERGAISRSIQHFQKKQLPFAWWVGFDNDPEWLEEELSTHGLKKSEEELAMAVNLSQVSWVDFPKGLEVKKVSEPTQVKDLISVLQEVFPEEEKKAVNAFFRASEKHLTDSEGKLHFFVGYVDQKPIATSSVFCSSGIASVFDVLVLPSMRGRGIGKAMTLAAMKDAKDEGYETCALTATNDAKYLYEKIGFKGLKMMAVYTHET